MMDPSKDISEAELEAQFKERHENLKHTVHNAVDSFDSALHSTLLEGQKKMQDAEQKVGESAPSTSDVKDAMPQQPKRRNSIGHQLNQSAMNAVRREMDAMHEIDSGKFESVASKVDETFGATALSDESLPHRTHRRLM
ncbi:hypothetical protein BCR43DRAFT_552893 [Syncephalastrum racemosum]|uniref:Uncharacterized protein n=1 Tax=Syncephalastrum racemosum TaxID=13706 RepID=A0A1X2H4N1_SYNRA|nr:hypothetical protein BCR43DRAFT_552893 [Syncephalastrum racemosum]